MIRVQSQGVRQAPAKESDLSHPIVFREGEIVVVETPSSFSIRLVRPDGSYRVLCSKAHGAKLGEPEGRYDSKREQAQSDAVFVARAVAKWVDRNCPECDPCVCARSRPDVTMRAPD